MPAAAAVIDHKIFMARIPPKTRQLLLGRSDRAGLVHLGLHWGATALVSVPIYTQVPFWWALLPVQGILIIFNFTLLHECTHQSPFRSLWLNEAVGWITGAAVGLPFIWFRYFHLAHHRFTNDPARDPELAGGPRPQNLGSYTLHITGLPVWKSQVLTLFSNAVGGGSGDFLPKSVGGKIQIESILLLLFYIVTAVYSFTVSGVLLWLWFVPILLGQPFLRLYLLAEHGRCPPVASMLENSRTTITNRIVRFLAWNMPYHAEHHCFPMVPFHQLPALHQLAKPYLQTTEQGYVRFNQKYLKALGTSLKID